MKRANAEARPYLFACAFVANAASFVLPISNPANLVVYGKTLPPLVPWLRVFALPSLISIGVTFLALRFDFRRSLRASVQRESAGVHLSGSGRRAIWGIGFTGAVLIAASGFGYDLGLPTCLAAIAAILAATRFNIVAVRKIARDVAWSVLPLVAGLFVLVEALNGAGASEDLGAALRFLSALPLWAGTLAASFGVAALSNVLNNLPTGLLAGSALQSVYVDAHLRHAVLVGVDLGPNLSVTGSLATVLWLIALRREGEKIAGWTFLKSGILAMAPALLFATLALLV